MAVGRQFGRETAIYLAGFVGAGLVQFLSIPVYSRALGPEQYGYLALMIATTTVLSGIMLLGGDVALGTDDAGVGILELRPTRLELRDDAADALQHVERFEPGDHDRDPVGSDERAVLMRAHHRAHVTGREEAVDPVRG